MEQPRWRRILNYYNPRYTNIGDVSYFLAWAGFVANFILAAAAVHTLAGSAGRGAHTRWIETLFDASFALLLAQVGTTIIATRKARDARRTH